MRNADEMCLRTGHGRDEQALGDVAGAHVVEHQLDDLPLTIGELCGARLPDHGPAPLTRLVLADQPRRQRSGNRRLPVRDTPQRCRDPLRVRVVEQVGDGPGADRVEEVSPVGRLGQHHDRRARNHRDDLGRRTDAAAGEHHRDQAEVRALAKRRGDRVRRVGGFGADRESVPLQERAHGGANARVLFGDDHSWPRAHVRSSLSFGFRITRWVRLRRTYRRGPLRGPRRGLAGARLELVRLGELRVLASEHLRQ